MVVLEKLHRLSPLRLYGWTGRGDLPTKKVWGVLDWMYWVCGKGTFGKDWKTKH